MHVDDTLATMNILQTAQHFRGLVARKTKSLRAKPIVNLLVDRSVINKFLMDTMEARVGDMLSPIPPLLYTGSRRNMMCPS